MSIPSSPTEKSIKSFVILMLQMTFAALLFCVFFILSVESKPLEDVPKACGYESCPVVDAKAINVHLIPHSHDDVGWLKTLDQYYFQDVQNVISSVVDALKLNPERRFVQVETAYFKKWWERQKDSVKLDVIKLVNNGQLEIINAAWSMNDEGAVHYQSTIDQFTLGLRYIEDNLGQCARPKVSWQIDPFGHSREQASISAHLGFDSFFFARLDYRDKRNRLDKRTMDLLWRGSANLGNTSDIFTSVLYHHYSAPPGFCFDIVCNDDPIIDDEESPDYNYKQRVEDFAKFVNEQAPHYPTNNILVTMGDDFRYEAALSTYINLDRLIEGFNLFPQKINDTPIKLLYSTPSCYTKAVNDYVISNDYKLELKTDDFFPYADGTNTYWTGYFTSRPASKRFEREGNNLLQVVKQLAAHSQWSYDNSQINSLKEAMGVMQHHDAITGTEKQHVTHNYHLLLSRAMREATEAAGTILAGMITGDGDNVEFESCLLANVSACAPTEAKEFTVVVYNPLSRAVTAPVTFPASLSTWQILAPDNSNVDYQLEASLSNFSYVDEANTQPQTVTFMAKHVPPLGFNVYRIKSLDSDTDIPPALKFNLTEPIGYDDTYFTIDPDTGLLNSVTMADLTMEVSQDFEYYNSADGSGAYIFIPDGDTSRVASGPVKVTPIGGSVYQGVLQEFSPWVKQAIKVYSDDRDYIEFDWIIGPISIDEGGKEIITKFKTSIENNGVFYTDSNGREMITRTRNSRPDYNYTDEQPVSGNYYPVNSKIVIKKPSQTFQGVEFAILTDRSQGGSSLRDGEIELMVHRACHSDDSRGVGEKLNEQEYGQGIVVRGKHYLNLGRTSVGNKTPPARQRNIAQRKLLAPWSFWTNQKFTPNLLTWSGLKETLPDNAHILTLEPWDVDTLLIRLEHPLEYGEDPVLSSDVWVDLSYLFTNFEVTELRETTLGGNVLLEESTRLHWPGSEANTNGTNPNPTDDFIVLKPMHIHTYLAKVTYKKYL